MPTNNLDYLGDSFLEIYIQQAIDFANGNSKIDGIKFRALTASAGVVVKDKQTRGAMKALDFQITRYTGSQMTEVARIEAKG
jgi:hypothetical protein